MITLKIDVMKIDKTKLFEGKNGAKYLDLVIMDSKNDKYGNDYMVVQAVSKEDQEKGVRGNILGNGKNVGTKSSGQSSEQSSSSSSNIDELPF